MLVYQLSEICAALLQNFFYSPLQVMKDTMCQFLVLRIFSLLKDKKGSYCIKLKLHTPEGVISSGNRDMLCSLLNTLHRMLSQFQLNLLTEISDGCVL